MKLTEQFLKVFSGQQCELYVAPFDVRFPDEDGEVKTLVQPDLCVICEHGKLNVALISVVYTFAFRLVNKFRYFLSVSRMPKGTAKPFILDIDKK